MKLSLPGTPGSCTATRPPSVAVAYSLAAVELLFLSLAMGSLIYVTRELFRIRFQTVSAVAAMTAVALGILIGFGTELVAEVAQSRATTQATTANAVTVRFANKQASPAS